MQYIKDITFHQTFMQLFLKFFFDQISGVPVLIHWSTKVKNLFGKVVGNTLVDKRNEITACTQGHWSTKAGCSEQPKGCEHNFVNESAQPSTSPKSVA